MSSTNDKIITCRQWWVFPDISNNIFNTNCYEPQGNLTWLKQSLRIEQKKLYKNGFEPTTLDFDVKPEVFDLTPALVHVLCFNPKCIEVYFLPHSITLFNENIACCYWWVSNFGSSWIVYKLDSSSLKAVDIIENYSLIVSIKAFLVMSNGELFIF